MIDDNNISMMEEDPELRELVVQTLENNGVLAKVRAELRASVFLTLEEQESVLNPEPFLNKSIKQYLSNSQGKILFSLVREFLEYFGLDYTTSVYDPETYLDKEYNYLGRQKLCEEFGIEETKEPILGELLKNTINSALFKSQLKNESCNNNNNNNNNESQMSNKSLKNIGNSTFDVSVSTIFQKDSSNSIAAANNDSWERLKNKSTSTIEMPINVTIKKKQNDDAAANKNTNNTIFLASKSHHPLSDEINNINVLISNKKREEKNFAQNSTSYTQDESYDNLEDKINSNIKFFKDHHHATNNKKKNKKQVESLINKNTGKSVFFDEIIIDGVNEKFVKSSKDNLPPLTRSSTNHLIFDDLPPLNGKKTNNISDIKELLDAAQGVSQNEKEEFLSLASGEESAACSEQRFISNSPETYITKQSPASCDDDESEKLQSNCLENLVEKKTNC